MLGLFRLDRGLNFTERGIEWNITQHTRIYFLYRPGIGLLVISILLGFLYSSLLILPKYWIHLDQLKVEYEGQIQVISTSATSSLTSTLSALSSTVVCCTTSTISILIPSLAVFLGPFVPVLLYVSYITIDYSIIQLIRSKMPLL